MTDLAFSSINMLFVLSFKNGNNNPTIDFINSYYMPLLEIKDFNVIIENKSFFDQPVKNKQKANEKLVEMLNNNDYTTDDDATMFFFITVKQQQTVLSFSLDSLIGTEYSNFFL